MSFSVRPTRGPQSTWLLCIAGPIRKPGSGAPLKEQALKYLREVAPNFWTGGLGVISRSSNNLWQSDGLKFWGREAWYQDLIREVYFRCEAWIRPIITCMAWCGFTIGLKYAAFLDAPLSCDADVYRLLEVKAVVRLTHNESKPQKTYYWGILWRLWTL